LLLREIRVRGWRNLTAESLALGDRVTVLFGKNGQGKSNFLEAAYYAITFRSFRTSSIGDVIGWGGDRSEIEARVMLRGLERTLRVEIEVGKKRTTLDGKAVRRDSESLQGAGVVVFGPDDLRLPKAAAAERRRAVDRAVFAVQRYLFSRGARLRASAEGQKRLASTGRAFARVARKLR
jgi:DNA replication and repair protein RecF